MASTHRKLPWSTTLLQHPQDSVENLAPSPEFEGLLVPPIAPSPLVGGHWCSTTTSCVRGGVPAFPSVPADHNGEISPRSEEDGDGALTDDESITTAGTTQIRRYDPYAATVLPPGAEDDEPVEEPEDQQEEDRSEHEVEDLDQNDGDVQELGQLFSLVHAPSLQGRLGFLPYPEGVVFGEVPEHIPPRSQAPFQEKLFLGHLWVRCGPSVVQWLIDQFALPIGCGHLAHLCAAQRHINKSGYYAGCAHAVLVAEQAGDIQWVMQRLHKRILFDLDGVWFAEDAEQQAFLASYCAWLCSLAQSERHALLQGLPCNPIAVEFAQNIKTVARPPAPL